MRISTLFTNASSRSSADAVAMIAMDDGKLMKLDEVFEGKNGKARIQRFVMAVKECWNVSERAFHDFMTFL
jgi:hypothetical protein